MGLMYCIYKNGVGLLLDLGAPAYDKFYFSKQRYESFSACSRSHTVPIINNGYQKAGNQYRAVNVSLDESGISMDIAPAYGQQTLTSLVRDVRFDCVTGTTTLRDTFRFTQVPERLVERFPLAEEPTLQKGVATLTHEGETLQIFFDPDVFEPVVSFDFAKKHANHTKQQSEETSLQKVYLLDLVVKNPLCECTYQIVIQ